MPKTNQQQAGEPKQHKKSGANKTTTNKNCLRKNNKNKYLEVKAMENLLEARSFPISLKLIYIKI